MRNYRTAIQQNGKSEEMSSMPYLGPSSIEEAHSRIDDAEKEIAKGRGYAFEDVIREARRRTSAHESSIY